MAFEKEGVLGGIRVIDFGQYIPGPFCSMILGDYGADVIHVDPPGGPVWDDPCNAAFMRGKRNISLNLKNEADLKIAKQLIATADVVVENFRPGVMDRLGLGHEEMLRINPMLVYVSIPGFSSRDKKRAHLRGWEGVVAAEGGLYQVSRYATDAQGNIVKNVPPSFRALYLPSAFGALNAAHSTVAALIARERMGKGQWVETSLYDACYPACGILGQEPYSSVWDKDVAFVRQNAMVNAPSIRYLSGFPCKDGKMCAISPPPRGIVKMREALVPEQYWHTPDKDIPPEVKDYVAAKWKEKTAREWEEYFQGVGAGCAVVQETKDWMRDDDALASDSVIELEDPILGKTFMIGSVVQTFSTPADMREPRHLPDADREEILAELATFTAPRPGKVTDPDLKAPLEGIKVLDLSQVLAGPITTKILVEYGADVIKINNPRAEENPIASAGHETNNAGKKTIFVDMKAPAGREILNALIRECDVFHSNFTPEAYKKLGYDEENLRKLNPEIIFSMANLFSAGGRRENYRGHEELAEALSGIATRNSGADKPETLDIMVCDHSCGEESALGILLALYGKMRSGKGQTVRGALSRTTVALQLPYAVDFEGKVWDEPRGHNVWGWSKANRLYACKDERSVFMAADLDGVSLNQLPEFGQVDLTAPDAEEKLAEIFKTDTAENWIAKLSVAGITAGRCRNYANEVMEDEYSKQVGLVVRRWHPGLGERRVFATAPKLSLTPARPGYAVPAYGTDSAAVLETLGMDDPEHLAVTVKVFTKSAAKPDSAPAAPASEKKDSGEPEKRYEY